MSDARPSWEVAGANTNTQVIAGHIYNTYFYCNHSCTIHAATLKLGTSLDTVGWSLARTAGLGWCHPYEKFESPEVGQCQSKSMGGAPA